MLYTDRWQQNKIMTKETRNKFLEKSASLYHNTIIKDWEKLYEKKREYLFSILKKHHVPGKALELGSADGIMTARLCKEFEKVTVVDGSDIFLSRIKETLKADNVELRCSLFEKFTTEERYNTIFMTHILEHLDNPVAVLKRSKQWLAENGHILIAVPNANSIHRHIGVKMGMLPENDALNEQDKILGHQRVYTPELLKQHIEEAGLKTKHFGGIMLKPISNRQMEKDWSEELIDAFFALGEDMPELCSEIYIVAG